MASEQRRSLQSAQRKARMLALEVDGVADANTLSGPDSQQCSLADNATGDYTLTILKQFTQAEPVVVATPETADTICIVAAKSASSVQIQCFDATDGTTAKDAKLSIMIMGADVSDKY
jgi:hypothetical protein